MSPDGRAAQVFQNTVRPMARKLII